MKRLFGVLRRVSGHHYPVLVVGESGTGKELVARGIHEHSPRAERRFIAVNCGAIPAPLFESELFGYEKGAFTGADRQKDGVFHDADGGTLFLDEVGELPEDAQAKLLRVLETGEVRRVGGTEVRHPDVRIVAATNRDLTKAVAAGGFREDLFFRLAVLSVEVPPLRERTEDIAILAQSLCARLHPDAAVSSEALEVLIRHAWPGNVRELRNVLTRAYVMGGPGIEVSSLSFHQLSSSSEPEPLVQLAFVDNAERAYIAQVIRRNGGNRSAAARELGMARSTLLYKLRKYGFA
jgi:transcriptional regulator with PAS, ATPase and Fis domain